ncbi:MAG: phosphotransferase [Aggregatilineales bacterium]
MMIAIRDDFKNILQARFGRDFTLPWTQLTGGYESDVWRVGDVVVRISPIWRSDAELQWVHDVTRHCATTISEVIAPLTTKDGSTVFRWQNHPITLYPLVTGDMLDLQDDAQVQQAARLLAKVHRSGLQWQAMRPRPKSAAAPTIPDNQQDSPDIIDLDLDKQCDTFFGMQPLTGIVHGDYYRANILCVDGQIRGIIDWDEAEIRPLLTEVAWACWEFTHNTAGDNLDIARAHQFLQTYHADHPILTNDAMSYIIPLMRRHLRYEIRRSIADENRGEDVDMNYRNAEIQAFQNLRGSTLDI